MPVIQQLNIPTRKFSLLDCPSPGVPIDSLVQPGRVISPKELPSPIEGTLTTVGRAIARGGFGDVYKGTWSRPGVEEPIAVTIKCVRPLDETENTRFRRRIKRETVIWKAAAHRNILPFIGYQFVDDVPMLVSPWCKHGNLVTYIRKNPNLTRSDKLKLLMDAARGLAHLHAHNPPIYHGDVKAENVIIQDDLEAALCDFGVSKIILEHQQHTDLTTNGGSQGTLGFQSPEFLNEEPPTSAVDVYAFGGLILTCMSGMPPFYGKRPVKVIKAILDGQTAKPQDHPQLPANDPIWGLMQECWSADPLARPTMPQILDRLEALRMAEFEDSL